jgi:hypothetical protein
MRTCETRHTQRYTNETGLISHYFSKEVLSNVPPRSGDKPYYLASLDLSNFLLSLFT